MATVTSVQSGNWSSASTWDTSSVPADGDTVIISSGHTVTFDVDQSSFTNGIDLTVNGILQASEDAGTYCLKLSSQLDGEGQLKAGTSLENPLPSDVTLTIDQNSNRIYGNNGLKLYIYCSMPNYLWSTLANSVSVGATQITLNDEVDWQVGDEIFIIKGDGSDWANNTQEKKTITAISGNTITLGSALSLDYDEGDYVAHITRNVKLINPPTSNQAIMYSSSSCIYAQVEGKYGFLYNCDYAEIGGSCVDYPAYYYFASYSEKMKINKMVYVCDSKTYNRRLLYSSVDSYVLDSLIAGCGYIAASNYDVVYTNDTVLTNIYKITEGSKIIFKDVVVKGQYSNTSSYESYWENTKFSTSSGNEFFMRGNKWYFKDCEFHADILAWKLANAVFDNCLFDVSAELNGYNHQNEILNNNFCVSYNHNQVLGAIKAWTRGGITIRDTTVQAPGFDCSLKMTPEINSDGNYYYCFWEGDHTLCNQTTKVRVYYKGGSGITEAKAQLIDVFDDPLIDSSATVLDEVTFTATNTNWQMAELSYTWNETYEKKVKLRLLAKGNGTCYWGYKLLHLPINVANQIGDGSNRFRRIFYTGLDLWG